jgi:TRF2-interacting telomeric protein/Rap1 - C terminal domain
LNRGKVAVNRIRVISGDVTVEIETAGTPPGGVGSSGRRPLGKEIPSTPGSSPVTIRNRLGGRVRKVVPEVHVEEMDVDEGEQEEEEELDQEEEQEQEEDEEEEEQEDGYMGPNTQLLHEAQDQDLEDYSIPVVDLSSRPSTPQRSPEPSTFLTNLDTWIATKSTKYSVSPSLVHYILERTSCRPKLSVKVLKYIRGTDGLELPDWAGLWTEQEDAVLGHMDARAIERLDEKHGRGASGVRREFLAEWTIAAREMRSRAGKQFESEMV